jgi:hypothetical protein
MQRLGGVTFSHEKAVSTLSDAWSKRVTITPW